MSFANRKRRSTNSNQSGQAVIEYLLILIVVVGIILGGLYQLNTAFRVWADNYFGNYLTCLLETGELPGLGGEDTNSECNEEFKTFSIAEGRPLIGDPLGEGGNGRDGSFQGDEDGESTAPPSRGSVEGGSSFASNSRRGNISGLPSRFRARGGGGGGDEDGGIDRTGDDGGRRYVNIPQDDGRPTRIAIDRDGLGRRARRGPDDEKKQKPRTKAKNVEKGDAQKSGPVLIPISNRQTASYEEPDIEPLTFGNFLRFLIIAAIVLAIVIFIGGQALQVSKSMD